MPDDDELRKFRLSILKSRYEHISEHARIRTRVIADLAFLGLRTIPFLSGGAIAAVIALRANGAFDANTAWLVTACSFFVLSLIGWMATFIVAYLAQNSIFEAEYLIAEQLAQELLGTPKELVTQADREVANRKLMRAVWMCGGCVIAFAAGAGCTFIAVLVGS